MLMSSEVVVHQIQKMLKPRDLFEVGVLKYGVQYTLIPMAVILPPAN